MPAYSVSPSEELVFQRMAHRKLQRELRGTYKRDKPWTLLWTFLILLLLFNLVAPNFAKDEDHKSFDIRVNIRNVGFFSFMAVVFTVLLVFALTRVVVVVRWSLYWLLATLSVLYLWSGNINLFSNDTPMPIFIAFCVLELGTFTVYFALKFVYPRFMQTNFFRENVGVVWWFGLRPVFRQKFTMSYDAKLFSLEGRRTCTYRGELDADGLPHGFGNWLDDSYHGELLSGVWERGEPVGPFRSREFGSGYAFESLRIGYLHCSDDTLESRNWFPSQNKLPTIGVASVECSVAGGFFSHLPRATVLEGPYCLASLFYSSAEQEANPFNGFGDEEEAAHRGANPYLHVNPHRPLRRVQDLMPALKVLLTEHPTSSLIITATRDRGVLVSGHSLASDVGVVNQLVIDILPGSDVGANDISGGEDAASFQYEEEVLSSAAAAEESEESDEDDVSSCYHTPLMENGAAAAAGEAAVPLFFDLSRIHGAALHNQLLQQQDPLVHRSYSFLLQGPRALLASSSSSAAAATNTLPPPPPLPPTQQQQRWRAPSANAAAAAATNGPYLKVRDWKSTVEGHVEALIFFPGFNASLEHSLQRLGQFMAMGRFPPHIKPFVFSWPCARELTYLYACELAKSRETHFALESFLRGLHGAGVRDIHFLVHSAGAQVITSGFREEEDSGERSALSKLFALANNTSHGSERGLLRLRTITLLNPDTPLSSFIARDFCGLRRVCDHITIVGDRKDGALDWSEKANGAVVTWRFLRTWFRCGCLLPRRRNSCAVCCRVYVEGCCRPYRHGADRPFSRVLAVGRNIFSLFVRDRCATKSASATSTSKQWLDVDVIDTSSMETNVHQLRHAYFDLNKILVEDLHELIVTGKRAAERSLLLHREGNIFSFCQAPACVVNQ